MDIQASSFKKNNVASGVRGFSGLAAGLIIVCLLLASSFTWAKDFSEVDGESGVIHVSGALTQGACRLEMQSAWQQIELGTVTTGDLITAGQRGTPVPFQLILRDCLMNGGRLQDTIKRGTVWDNMQPVVSVSFVAPADNTTPGLMKVDGAQGLGLRLLDSLQRDVRLGNRSEPVFVSPHRDVLTWYVVPERTSAPLIAGAFTATVSFRLNYD